MEKKDAPPSYATATGSSTTSKPSHLQVPQSHNGIPAAYRRSMEDEHRPLPEGWVRQWDDKEQHQFFVDTKANPPRSIWVHPHDDETYLNTLTSEERELLQEQEREWAYDNTDDESSRKTSSAKLGDSSSAKPISAQNTGSSFPAELPPRKSTSGKVGFGEKLKEKVTGQTKEERAKQKALRDQQEKEYYEAHVKFRQAMQQAQMTGQPVWFARDPQGHDVYVEPPNMMYGQNYGNNAYGYNPYQSGPYASPNARFIRPANPYAGRPYGGAYGGGYGGYGGYGRPGYGGGMGMPIAGGLLGGMLLGGLLF